MFGIDTEYNPDRFKEMIISQQYDWDCWLAAIRTILKMYDEHEYDSLSVLQQLVQILQRENLRYSNIQGGYFVYIPLVLYYMGIDVELYIPHSLVPEMYNKELSLQICTEIEANSVSLLSPRKYLFHCLSRILMLGIPVKIVETCLPIMQERLTKNCDAIVQVPCSDYYGVDNDSAGHTLILTVDSGHHVVLDVFQERLEIAYCNASLCIQHVMQYNWNSWNGWLCLCKRKS